MDQIGKESHTIQWYDIREQYLDERIYPSQKKSIIENFRFRLFSQDKNGVHSQFPIKLIRSVFTNAVNIFSPFSCDQYNSEHLKKAKELKNKLDNTIDNCIDRILLYVADSQITDEVYPNSVTANKLWAYPLSAVKKFGFHPITGECFIELFRDSDNTRQLYKYNSKTATGSKITGVKKLSQLSLMKYPGIEDILIHNMPDLKGLNKLISMNVTTDDIKLNNQHKNITLWNNLFPMLEELLHDVIVVFSQSCFILTKK